MPPSSPLDKAKEGVIIVGQSVAIPIPIQEIVPEPEQTSRTYKLDLERGRIFKAGSADGLEAVNQFIMKTLLTPRFRCLIYDNQYGSEIKQTIIAEDGTSEFIQTELPRQVKDALLTDSRILDVYGFTVSLEHEWAVIGFSANTVFGESVIQEVL